MPICSRSDSWYIHLFSERFLTILPKQCFCTHRNSGFSLTQVLSLSRVQIVKILLSLTFRSKILFSRQKRIRIIMLILITCMLTNMYQTENQSGYI